MFTVCTLSNACFGTNLVLFLIHKLKKKNYLFCLDYLSIFYQIDQFVIFLFVLVNNNNTKTELLGNLERIGWAEGPLLKLNRFSLQTFAKA